MNVEKPQHQEMITFLAFEQSKADEIFVPKPSLQISFNADDY